MSFNYAAWVKRKLDDPRTSTADYRRYWSEWQDLVHQQKVVDEQARQRRSFNQSTEGHPS